MQTITTKYLGPTNTKGARVKATTSSGISVIIPYAYDEDTFRAHALAVEALCKKVGWSGGSLIAGDTKTGYVFVWANGPIVKI